MEQNFENYDIRLTEANVENLKKNADKSIKSHRCNQCDFTSSHTSALGTHLKTHSEEKSNICNQCDFSSSQAGNLRRHLKYTVEKSQTNAVNVIFHALWQPI